MTSPLQEGLARGIARGRRGASPLFKHFSVPMLPAILRYLIPPAAIALAWLLRSHLLQHTHISPFVFFYAVIALSAWIGGWVEGLLAVMLSATVANYALMGSFPGWSTSGPELTATGLFMVGASVLALLCAAFRETAIREKQSRKELTRSNDELKRLLEALRNADQQKNAFLAILSHELRNPLMPIRSSIYILQRATPGGEQAKRALMVIDRQATHVARLVDDLLDFTRISRGKIRLQRESLNLNDIVRGTLDDLRMLFSSNGIDLRVCITDKTLRVFGDRTRIAQIVGNLLQNAAKFTPSGGRVDLALEDDDAGSALIRVRDTGVGIDRYVLERLFEPFVQADHTIDRPKGGLGLGLTLVKNLVELHGGKVTACSEGSGAGSEFTVRLPLEKHKPLVAPHALGQKKAVSARKRRRVLVIEDNVDAAESLKQALEFNGHEVETACTGLEGIEKARASHPDVVLCDIGLPGIDGIEVARRMRKDPVLRAAYLVAISGYAAADDLERSREAGFMRHLAKPPDLKQLEDTISEAIAT